MNIKWPESVMMKFLKLYKQHDCLWNHRLDNYKNRDAREHALTCIVVEMGIAGLTVSDVKNKIKTIRTMYKKEHSLVCKSKSSGMDTEDLHVPKLFWYKTADTFLNDVTRVTSSNLNGEGAENELPEDTQETVADSGLSASESSANTNADTREYPLHVENTESLNRSATKPPKPPFKFRPPSSLQRKMVQDLSSAIDKLGKVVKNNNKNETVNEFDIFGKHVAVQLQQMPLYDALMCQEQIQTVLRQKRLELLMKQTHTTPSPVFSPSSSCTPSPGCSNTMDEEF